MPLVVYIGGGLVLAMLMIVILVIVSKKRKHKKKMQQLVQDKTREEILDNLILNKNANIDDLRAASERPYDIRYTVGERPKGKNKKRHVTMLQIDEISDLSSRKYILDPSEVITIGSASENKISLTDALIDERQCEIGLYERDNRTIYLQNVGEKRVVLIRKKKWIPVGSERIVLMNGDTVEIGRVQLKISFV